MRWRFRVALLVCFFALCKAEEEYDYYSDEEEEEQQQQQDSGLATCDASSNPRCGMDVLEYVQWLRETNPQKVFTDELFQNRDFDDDSCENHYESDEECDDWAASGECDINPNFMNFECSRSCGVCRIFKDMNYRCQRSADQMPAYFNGDVQMVFERMLNHSEWMQQYNIEIINRDPWIIVLNDFLSELEIQEFMIYGAIGFERSADAGKMKDDGSGQFESVISNARTSQTSWCTDFPECWQRPIIQQVLDRVENMTLIPRENSEYFQFLKYEKEEYYVEHHDFIPGHLRLPIGPRLLTVFFYLNDVDQGGQTRFSQLFDDNGLPIQVDPRKGRVVIWANVRNRNVNARDHRTHHEALKPESSEKYGVNLWLHQYNFQEPYKVFCTG